MAAVRTAWHVLLATLLHQRAPRRFEVRSEVPLSTEPLRADYLLLSTLPEADDGDPAPPPKRWRLWNLLPKDTLVELKSTGRPYRSRNMSRLWAYLHLYYADQAVRLLTPDDLAGVLLVAEPRTLEAHRWLYEQGGTKERAMEIHDLEGYDEIIQKIVTGLPPEKVLSAFKPEQRLAGLPPNQAVLALPDELLRALSDEYLETLPAAIRAVIRDRIGR